MKTGKISDDIQSSFWITLFQRLTFAVHFQSYLVILGTSLMITPGMVELNIDLLVIGFTVCLVFGEEFK